MSRMSLSELERFCNSKGVRMVERYGEARGDGWKGAVHNWRVTLKYKGRQLTTDFFTGGNTDITPGSVLGCLLADGGVAGNLDFLDYDFEPGREEEKAHIYKMCEKTSKDLDRFLGSERALFESKEH